MKRVWIAADSIVSPLGWTTEENYANVREGISGIRRVDDAALSHQAFSGALMQEKLPESSLSRFEYLCDRALQQALRNITLPKDRTIFILSTTKGNISFLEEGKPDHPRIHLHAAAGMLAGRIGIPHHLAISNACISGVMATIVARRLLLTGQYDHAVVLGADVLNRFVISGFQSLQALTAEPCRPFDAGRKGINLGECAAVMILSTAPEQLGVSASVEILGGGLSNDANHISGPSRTGEELGFAIRQALQESGLTERDIDFICAHGTATLYNDEMEAKAFHHVGMESTPLHSLKGYFGHTLGAAGVVEMIICAESLKRDELVPSLGFETPGTSQPVNVIRTLEQRTLKTCLKTASGFGGCNAAIILQEQ
jgi:3-oxoacyl-[acyl-carrier-protein] synthase-1